jgi:hypothetical protein
MAGEWRRISKGSPAAIGKSEAGANSTHLKCRPQRFTLRASRLQRCSASNPKTDMLSSEYIILADPIIYCI